MTRLAGALLVLGVATAGAARAAEPLCRVTLTLSPEQPFVEQAIDWYLLIESRPEVHTIEWSEAPRFPGARAERVRVVSDAPHDVVWKHSEERRVLFAERAGELRLPEARLRCTSGAGSQEVALAARRLAVRPLPGPRPPGFGGLVGRLGVRRTVSPQELRLGEAVRVRVELRGGGNLWSAPETVAMPPVAGAELFPQPGELRIERGGGLRVARTIVYDVVPRSAGRFELPALAIDWFDPETARFRQARAPAVAIAVGQRAARAPAPEPPEPAPRGAGETGGLLALAWLWTALKAGGVVAAALGLGLWLRGRRRVRPAERTARVPEAGDAAALARALREALVHRLPDTARLSPDEILARDDLAPPERAAAELLAAAERARFARDAPSPARDAVARAIAAL